MSPSNVEQSFGRFGDVAGDGMPAGGAVATNAARAVVVVGQENFQRINGDPAPIFFDQSP